MQLGTLHPPNQLVHPFESSVSVAQLDLFLLVLKNSSKVRVRTQIAKAILTLDKSLLSGSQFPPLLSCACGLGHRGSLA